MKRGSRRASFSAAMLASAITLVVAGERHTAAGAAPTPVRTWTLPGGDRGNDRDAGGPIDSSNVASLRIAWTDPILAKPSQTHSYLVYAASPVVARGVMYTEDLDANVEAINLRTGAVLWIHSYHSPDGGPNGVSVADGLVFGVTATSAFALQAATGRQLWIRRLTRNANEGVDMAPGYNAGTVYVSTVPGNKRGFYRGDGQAILWALDARSGVTRWKWDEVPATLWSRKHTTVNSGGGQWYPPSFDRQGNLYVGVANPGPWPGTADFPFGTSRPGPNLYTDSIVKLDARDGHLMWHYQLTPHDIYDWDLEDSPILANAGGRAIVIDGGKAGFLVAVDARSGELVWKRSVGIHNGHTDDGLLTQHGRSAALRLPETVEPGYLGGILSQLASNGNTVYAAVNNLAMRITDQSSTDTTFPGGYDAGTGELVAVDEATGKVKWDDKLPSSPYGAATLANDVVFTTTYDGRLYAFNARTGARLWRVMLPAGTNSPVVVVGDTVLTAASVAARPGQRARIIAFRLARER